MTDYIKRETVVCIFDQLIGFSDEITKAGVGGILQKLKESINAIQYDDVVEVVRCKDCKYWKSNTEFCEFWSALNVAQRTCKNDYCSYGERQGN